MTRRTATSLKIAVATVALGTIAAACSQTSEPTGDVGQGRASGDAVTVAIEDSDYKPATLRASAGEEVTIEVTNNDDISHDLAIEAFDLNTGTIEAGKSATATFTMPDESVEFVCTYHGGMDGRIDPR